MRSSRTGLSPDWGRGFNEAFTDLISHDDDLVRAEFTDLTRGAWCPATAECLPVPEAPGTAGGSRHPGDR
jgi:hypothetical protein